MCFYINEQINVGSKKKKTKTLCSITRLSMKDRRLEKVFVLCPWTGDLDKNRLMTLGQPYFMSSLATSSSCGCSVLQQCSTRGREAFQHNWALHASWEELEFHEECFEGRFLTHTKPSTYWNWDCEAFCWLQWVLFASMYMTTVYILNKIISNFIFWKILLWS